jgi:hypothetical protein
MGNVEASLPCGRIVANLAFDQEGMSGILFRVIL